jgi:hypothetical protein
VRAADEAQHSEVAEDFQAPLLDAGIDYIPFYISFLLDVYRFLQY